MTAVYVRYLNIQRFEQLLAGESDPEKRRVIECLLAEERAKIPDDDDKGRPPGADGAGEPAKP